MSLDRPVAPANPTRHGAFKTATTQVGVLDKAVMIIDVVAAGATTVSEICERSGLSRATAYRLVTALQAHQMIDRDKTGRIELGRRLRLAGDGDAGLVAAAKPLLAALRDATRESTQLYRRFGNLRLCLATAERHSGLRDIVPIGAELPMTAGSAAQVLLAWAEDDAVAEILATAEFSGKTLARVRQQGWAWTVGERDAGTASLSAPVIVGDRLLAALSVSGPVTRMAAAKQTMRKLVTVAAAELGQIITETVAAR